MDRGGFPTSTDGFILGPPHGSVGRLTSLISCAEAWRFPAKLVQTNGKCSASKLASAPAPLSYRQLQYAHLWAIGFFGGVDRPVDQRAQLRQARHRSRQRLEPGNHRRHVRDHWREDSLHHQ